MTDVVERLNDIRLKVFHSNTFCDKNLYFEALSRAFQNGDLVAATSLEAKDKELAALRERLQGLEAEKAFGWIEAIDNQHDRNASMWQARAEAKDKELAALREQLDRCGKDNCMGQRSEGAATWVREERLIEAEARAETAERERDEAIAALNNRTKESRTMTIENAPTWIGFLSETRTDAVTDMELIVLCEETENKATINFVNGEVVYAGNMPISESAKIFFERTASLYFFEIQMIRRERDEAIAALKAEQSRGSYHCD